MRHLVAFCPKLLQRVVSLVACGAFSFGCGGKSSSPEEPPADEEFTNIASGAQPDANTGKGSGGNPPATVVPVAAGPQPVPAKPAAPPKPVTPPAPPPDVTAPVVSGVTSYLVNAPVVLSATADETVTWDWSVVSGPSGAVFAMPNEASTSFSAITDGTYEIRAKATDAAGNMSELAVTLIWDATPPVVDAGVNLLANSAVMTSASASDYMTLSWSLVSGAGTVTFSDPAVLQPQITASADGMYTLRLTASDEVGNVASDELTLRWDTTAPTVSSFPLTGAAVDGFISGNEQASPLAITTGAVADENTTIRYAVISGASACDGGASLLGALPLSDDTGFGADGEYRICAELVDDLGHVTYAATSLITVDTVAPLASAAGLPAALTRDDTLNVQVEGAEVAGYRYKFGPATGVTCADNADYGTVIVVGQPIAASLSAYPNDNLRLCIIGSDAAGNEQALASAFEYTWSTDRVPPAAPVGFVLSATGNGSRYKWQSGSADAVSYVVVRRAGASVNFEPVAGENYVTDGTPDGGVHIIGYSGPDTRQTETGLTAGTTYYYAVHAVDAAGNVSPPATGNITAADVVPFNVASGFNNIVRTILKSSSGHIYVGGDFTTYINHQSSRLIRLNSDYSIDTTFSIGAGFNGSIYALAEDGDGNIVAAGAFTTYKGVATNRIVKIDADGNTVTDFAIGTGLNNTVYALALDQATGAVFAGGTFTTYKGVTHNRLVKIAADGTAETTFANNGGFNNNVFALDWDKVNNLIYVGGQFTSYQGSTRNRIVRLTPAGAVDSTFAVGTAANNIVYAITRDSAGMIYLGGNFTSFAGTSLSRIIRLTSGGTRDATFAIGTGFGAAVRTLALASDGSAIYAGGDFTSYAGTTINRLARILTTGARDTTFVHGSGVEATVFAILPNSESEILWGGTFTVFNSSARNRIMLTDSLGAPNDDLVPFGAGLNSTSFDATPVQDGMYTVVGAFTSYNARTANRIIRIGADNQADPTFITGAGLNNSAYSLAEDPVSGKVYVGGIFTSYAGTAINRIVGINRNGSRDTSFNVGTGFNSDVQCVRYDPVSGKLYVSGKFTTYNGTAVNRIARLGLDGALDTTFAVGTGFNSDVNVLHINADGTLFAGGAFTTYKGTTYNRIVKLNPDGSIDSSFNQGTGFNTGNVLTITASVSGIYAGGSFTQYKGISANRIVAIDAAGNRDTAFNAGTGFNNTVYSIAVDPFDSDLLVGGLFTQYSGMTGKTRIVRLRNSGSIEASFVTGAGANSDVRRIHVSESSIYAAGLFSTYDNVISGSFMRLQHYGTLD